MAAPRQRLPEPEELFGDYVKRMARHRAGRQVVLVHLSRLELINRTRHHIELVTTRLVQIARQYDGQVFPFVNGDVACVLHDAPGPAIDNVIFDIRYSFSDDTHVKAEDAGEAIFIEKFDVTWDYDRIEDLARERLTAFREALSASMTQAEDELHAASSVQGPEVAGGPAASGDATASSGAGALQSRPHRVPARAPRAVQPKAAPSDPVHGLFPVWLEDNAVTVGGAALTLSSILACVPVFELGPTGARRASEWVEIDTAGLSQAYATSVGIKMSEQLEGFLASEAEAALASLLEYLDAPSVNDVLDCHLALRLNVEVILSSSFLMATRAWEAAGEKGFLFWFTPEDLAAEEARLRYVCEFLHDTGNAVGVRDIEPGDIETFANRLPAVDAWSLKWPETDLTRTPQGEIDGLKRALAEWGRSSCFVQGLNSENKIRDARAFGYGFAEGLDAASLKLLTRK